MWRANLHKLWIVLLVSALLALPAAALPADAEASGSWWQTSLDTVLAWVFGGPQSLDPASSTGDDGNGPVLSPEGPQTLDGAGEESDSTGGNTYPGLDPDG